MEGQEPNIHVAQAGDNHCSTEPALIVNSQDVEGFAESPSNEAKLDGNDSDLFITGVDSSSNMILWVRIGSRGCVKGLD